MEIKEIFQVLGIEETKDEGAIKRAYREKLAVTNPEDNPEGFKRLRTAYEEACVYAQAEEEEPQEEDTTPSGLWVQKAARIYDNIEMRREVSCWKELFEEDIFLSLEEEENCRVKLLQFMLDHFRFPTEVWKLFDAKLHILEGDTGLREQFPADFINYMMNRCRQGEDVEFDQFTGTPDADYDLFIRYMECCWGIMREDKTEQLDEYIRNADELGITHPSMEHIRAWYMTKQGKVKEAADHMLQLWEKYPEDLIVSFNTAELLWQNDMKEKSAKVYESIKSNINERHYMANMRLTEWYLEKEDYAKAKDCAEEVLALGAGNDEFQELLLQINQKLEEDYAGKYAQLKDYANGSELAFCYLQDGRYAEGLALALELGRVVPRDKAAEYRGLMAKLHVEGADFEEAIEWAEKWEQALQDKIKANTDDEKERDADKNRVGQSLAIRLECYHKLGLKDKAYFEKALAVIERMDALKGDGAGINMRMEKARIYYDMGEYEKCLEVTTELIEKHQVYAAHAIAQKAYKGMWDARGVVQSGYMCIRYFPDYTGAYEHIAEVYLQLKYTEDLVKLLNEAEQNGVKSVLLDAYRYQMTHEPFTGAEIEEKMKEFEEKYQNPLADGNEECFEKGLPVINEYLYKYPGPYMLYKRGIFYMAANKMEEAEEDFRKILELEPGDPYAYDELLELYVRKGMFENALICAKMAKLYFDEVYYGMHLKIARIYSRLGQPQMALKSCDEMFKVGGDRAWNNTTVIGDYVHILSCAGRLDEAERVINTTYKDRAPKRYHELIDFYNSTNQKDKAALAVQQWSRWHIANTANSDKESRFEYYKILGFRELLFGEPDEAVKYMEAAVKEQHRKPDAYSYTDLMLMCILTGNDDKGRKYAAKMQQLDKEHAASGQPERYHHMEKAILQKEFLMHYYDAAPEELEKIMETEKTSLTCFQCAYSVCKEFEAVRLVYMVRIGRRQEALELLDKYLKGCVYNDFLLAVKRYCEMGTITGDEELSGISGSDSKTEKGLFRGLTKLFGGTDKK